MTYHDELQFLYSLQKFGIKFGLSQTTNLLRDLGNPHQGRRFIHLAGTNGKGSVASFLSCILQKAGFRVGLYTSPHLVRFSERFQINSREISPAALTALARELRSVIDHKEPPTFFEAVTAMGLKYFADAQTDLDIIETGMGGRLDATNCIDPLLTVITNISLEHQEYLGTSLKAIAREKAGIIKPGVPLVSGASQPSVQAIVQRTCHELGAPLLMAGQDFRYRSTRNGLHYFGLQRRLNGLQLGLQGAHQARNAALSLAGIEVLASQGLHVQAQALREGLQQATWPGRMQLLAGPPRILLDGAHNVAAVKSLCTALKDEFSYRRLVLVIGIMADKEVKRMLGFLLPLADHVIFTRPLYERAMDPENLQEQARDWSRSGEVIQSLGPALERARDCSQEEDLIVVTGSLFTVGEALSLLDPVGFAPD